MTIVRLSHALVAAAVVLAMASYALADRFVLLAVVALPLVVMGWYGADAKGLRLLPRPIADILVLGTIVWSGYRVTSVGWSEGLTVSVFCEFLIAIIMIKMWDRKRARDSAQILTLAVFLTVGSMLTGASLWLGVMLLLDVIVLLAAVTVFHIAAGYERVGATAPRGAVPLVGLGEHAVSRLARTLVLSFGLCLVLSAVVFLLMPRGIGLGQLGRFGQPTGGRQTGLSETVNLRDSGLISESARTVLEAKFESLTGEPLGAEGRVFYLRAVVLDTYEQGAWTSGQRESTLADHVNARERVTIGGSPGGEGIVQTIDMVIAPRRGPVPHLYKVVELWSEEPGAYYATMRRRSRNPDPDGLIGRDGEPGLFRYTVVSAPARNPEVPEFERPANLPVFPVRAVGEHAARVLREDGMEPDPAVRPRGQDLEACRVLERYLHRGFSYTLNPGRAPRGRDPIDWFLNDAKSGHCEYFASAMAGMCRSIGINARVIAGYAAGEYDERTQRYTVRESNAHAWVEAEVARGVWLTFDPTPPDTLRARLKPPGGLAGRWAAFLDSMDHVWSSSFISFDESSRRKLLGAGADPEPWLREKLESLREQFLEGGLWAGLGVLAGAAWRMAAAIAGAVLLIWGIRVLGRRVRASVRRHAELRADPDLARAMGNTEFFRRSLALLRRRGHPKPDWLPPLAHAERVGAQDARLAHAAGLAAETYYRARFGRRALTEEELGAVHRALDEASRP